MACRLQEDPRRVLYFRIQSGRTQNNITSVCVYIYYIANEQIAAMWHGLVAWQLRKETHTHRLTHYPYTPITNCLLPLCLYWPQYTHMCTHTITRPTVFSACLSISSCRALGWEYLSSLWWVEASQRPTHTHVHRVQGDHSVYWLNVWWDSSLSKTLLETSR